MDTVIDPSKDERVDDLIDRVNEMKSFNTEAISKLKIYTIHDMKIIRN